MSAAAGGVFPGIVAAARERWNGLFTQARWQRRGLDGEAVLAHLRDTVAPIVDTVAAHRPEAAAEVADRLYGLSLDLIGRDLIGPGARYPVVDDGWRRLLGGLPHLTAAAPDGLARAVTNALVALSEQPGVAPPGLWIARMAVAGAACPDLAAFRAAGALAAWRGGMAPLRAAALAAAPDLPAEAVRAALGLGADAPADLPADLIKRLADNRWLDPERPDAERRLRIVAEIGGFRGFGGPFLTPPVATVNDGRLVVHDAESGWELHADACGAVLVRTTLEPGPPSETRSGRFVVEPDGRIACGLLRAVLPDLAWPASWAGDRATLAVTLPRSHRVWLVATGPLP